jgi:two-component system LytT family response regulator
MIKIAIYDDSAGDNKNCLASLVSQFFLSKNAPHSMTAFDSSIELLRLLKTEPVFDIALISMMPPGSSPLCLACPENGKCVLVLSVYSDEFTLRDNPLYKFDYFFYPDRESEIFLLLEKVLARIKKNSGLIPIKINRFIQDFPASKIIYIESSKHYLFFHTTNGAALKAYAKLDEYENILSGFCNFMRCHQSFIVNMDYVKQLCGHDFIMAGNLRIPIRKSGFSNYKKKYFAYKLAKYSRDLREEY